MKPGNISHCDNHCGCHISNSPKMSSPSQEFLKLGQQLGQIQGANVFGLKKNFIIIFTKL